MSVIQNKDVALFKDSIYLSEVILFLEHFYLHRSYYPSIKESLFKRLFLFFLCPIFIFLTIWLNAKETSLTKQFREVNKNIRSLNEYLEFKRNQETIQKLVDELNKSMDYEPRWFPFPFSILFKKNQKSKLSLFAFYSTMARKYDVELNISNYNFKTTSFIFKSESELWEKRNKAYKYWF
jgi:hypothetical protein